MASKYTRLLTQNKNYPVLKTSHPLEWIKNKQDNKILLHNFLVCETICDPSSIRRSIPREVKFTWANSNVSRRDPQLMLGPEAHCENSIHPRLPVHSWLLVRRIVKSLDMPIVCKRTIFQAMSRHMWLHRNWGLIFKLTKCTIRISGKKGHIVLLSYGLLQISICGFVADINELNSPIWVYDLDLGFDVDCQCWELFILQAKVVQRKRFLFNWIHFQMITASCIFCQVKITMWQSKIFVNKQKLFYLSDSCCISHSGRDSSVWQFYAQPHSFIRLYIDADSFIFMNVESLQVVVIM